MQVLHRTAPLSIDGIHVLTLGLVLACGCIADANADPDGLDPRCDEPCARRVAKGCAGDPMICRASCTGIYVAANAEGVCKEAANAKEDCFQSPAVLDLGCSPPFDEKERVCQDEIDAYQACRMQRDGR